jgi:hypothetical protein
VAASVVASQAVDTRDWMRPERPHELLAHAARVLQAPVADAPTLVERLGRPGSGRPGRAPGQSLIAKPARRKGARSAARQWPGVLVLASVLGVGNGAALAAIEKARPSDEAAEMVGVTHLVYTDKIYDTGYESIIKPRLIESGIRYIRDWVTTEPRYVARYRELARHGIRALLINWDPGPAARDAVKALNEDPSRPVAMVEPFNERDCDRRSDWRPIVRDFQKAM